MVLTQLAIMSAQVPASPNYVCFSSTWVERNKRNMHSSEQQTSVI